MATRVLGLDIHKEYLSAVVVEQRGTGHTVRACGSLEVDGPGQVDEALSEFLQQSGFQVDSCVLGLPLSFISLRNLTLPFTDRRKMTQVLPLELEEQLLVPMEDQIIDFMVTGRRGAGSHLLIGAVERVILQKLLPILKENGLTPQAVAPAVSFLTREHMQDRGLTEPTLFLHADIHAMSMALWIDGRVVFMRRIAYAQQFLVESFLGGRKGLAVLDQQTAEQSLTRVCAAITTSLYFFQQEFGDKLQIGGAVLSGCLTGENRYQELISHELGLKVAASPPLHEKNTIQLAPSVEEHWQPFRFETPLALALGGLKRKKLQDLNFLQGEFARDSRLFLSKRSLLAAAVVFSLICVAGIGFMLVDYRTLNTRATDLHREMVAVFKQTFPEVTRVVAPYVQMQSKLSEVRSSEVAIPLFSGDKRVLEILADISGRIPKDLSLHVSRLVIDQESVQIKGTTDAYNNVDVIKNVASKLLNAQKPLKPLQQASLVVEELSL
ncbi:MAG: type II secretion system protein GspL [Desulfobulbaceae bacterium]|nr:type II secretion system protein GspL [Desulfobulbaceae bacterium]